MSNSFRNGFVNTPAFWLVLGIALGIFAASAPLFTFWNELQKSKVETAAALQTNAELESRAHSLQEERDRGQSQLKLAVQEQQASMAQVKKLQESLKFHQDIRSFLQSKVLKAGADTSLRKRVEALAPTIAESCKNQPFTEAAQRAALGAVYLALKDPPAAVVQHEQSQHILVEQLGDEHALTIAGARELALAYLAAGKPAAAVDVLERQLANLPDKLAGMPALADAYRAANRFEEAANMYREAIALEQKKKGNNGVVVSALSRSLAEVLQAAGRHADAATIYERLVSRSPDAARRSSDRLQLAGAYAETEKYEQAIALYQQLLASPEYKLDSARPQCLEALKGLAGCYQSLHRYADAMACYQRLLKTQLASAGADAPDALETKASLADAYLGAGKTAAALQLDNEVLAAWLRQAGPEHLQTLMSSRKLGIAYGKAKDFDRAKPILVRALTELEQKQPGSWVTFETMSWLGEALAGQRSHAEAEALLLKAHDGLKRKRDSIPPRERSVISESQQRLVHLYEQWGKLEAARRWREDAQTDAAAAP